MATLAAHGLPVGTLIAPIIPGLTDGWGALGGLMAASKEAGARFAVGSALRLAPVARAGFLPLLEREFPELVTRYRRRYGRSATAGKAYLTALDRRLRALQEIHGFARTSLRFGE
jgi:DNA repair photolyase